MERFTPRIFCQSYSIHAIVDGKCIPLVFALLEDQKQTTYTCLLKLIQLFLPELDVGTVMVDFELAAMNAFRHVFVGFLVRLDHMSYILGWCSGVP